MQFRRNVIFCFLAVYIIWGSTYLGIRYAIETIPPWAMTAIRFFVASFFMFLIARLRREEALTKQERNIALVSGLLLIFANGVIGVVEKWVSSGIVAVMVGAMPIWIMLIGWMFFRQARPSSRKFAGALVGLSGVALIAADQFSIAGNSEASVGLLMLFCSSIIWATGTLLQRKAPRVKSTFLFSYYQMLMGAVGGLVMSLIFENPAHVPWGAVTAVSWAALAYLIVFGSLIGFTAYAWLSRNVEPHLVSTYALVNPVIAVGLGWLLLSEPITPRFFGATALVLSGLVILMFQPRFGRRPLGERKAA